MPTGSVFAGDAAGGGVNIQQGKYTGEFDFAAGGGGGGPFVGGGSMDWVYDSGDEVLDLTDPDLPACPPGLYQVTALFWWNESETGAAISLSLALAGGGTTTDMDLGVIHPGQTAGGNGTQTVSGLVAGEGEVAAASVFHSRAASNLTGGVEIYVTRMYGGAGA